MPDATTREPKDLTELHATYLESHGKIEGHARLRFAHLRGQDRDDAVAEVVARAWRDYRRLFEQGRTIEGKRGGIAKYAAMTVASGRRLVTESARDVMRLGPAREDELADGRSPAEAAAFSVDIEQWMATLRGRDREIVGHFAAGLNTVEVANVYGVTRAAIHAVRKRLARSWAAFHGEGPGNPTACS